MTSSNLSTHPIHLGLNATAESQPEFTGDMDWYAAYGDRHSQDGPEGRLVTMHSFTEPWTTWEMHPHGSEVILCTAGSITLLQEQADGTIETTTLGPGQYAINPPGIWHTADIENHATAVFITAGLGTEQRLRSKLPSESR